MLAELVAVCIGVSDGEVHHRRGHDNYYFKDFVCSTKNLPIEPESCGKVKDFLERSYNPLDDLLRDFFTLPPSPPISPEALMKLREFYDLCCLEA